VIRKSKQAFSEKVQSKFEEGHSREVWKGVGTIVGTKKKNVTVEVEGDPDVFVNNLNTFYARFDSHDDEIDDIRHELSNVQNDESLVVSEEEVKNVFSGLNPRKAQGPDGISPRLLRECAQELASIFQIIFNMTIAQGKIPLLWKTSKLVPVPKKKTCTEFNDYRPIALTPVVMKCLERLILKRLMNQTDDKLDPLQFAYRANRGTDDACILIVHTILEHLEKPNTSARVLLIDFSSAFNTVKPSLMYHKLSEMSVSAQLIRWVMDFLLDRSQYVCIGQSGCVSDSIVINTGTPQGCVLSPTLYTLYTNECRSRSEKNKLIKFADDSALLGLIENDDNSEYLSEVENLTSWCSTNNLDLNVGKTKEMLCDFRKRKVTPPLIEIGGREVERVTEYKYLGTIISADMTWSSHVDNMVKKMSFKAILSQKVETVQDEPDNIDFVL
jgi:hypothetical protein